MSQAQNTLVSMSLESSPQPLGRSFEGSKQPLPFLRWAGGKRALLPTLLKHVPAEFDTYYEPFLGAGSLFFSLPSHLDKVVSDFNSELISTYDTLRTNVAGVLEQLSTLTNSKEDYLRVRAWDREPAFLSRSAEARAARFIYLNKCGFNGLYRVNRQGFYNVPYGNPRKVDFLMESNLKAVSDFLKTSNAAGRPAVTTSAGDYKAILQKATGAGSFVYLDPPYAPLSATSGFVDYNENGFGASHQEELRDEILRLTGEGVKVLLSNSAAKLITNDLYRSEIFTITPVNVRRAIAAKSSSRGVISEVLIDNYAAFKGH